MPDIRHLLQIDAPPSTVFPLVATARGFTQWWAADAHDVTGPQPGVELRFAGGQTIYRLRAETFLPPVQAAWACETGKEWSGTQLIFLLSPQGPGTLLRFLHSDWQQETDYFASCNTVWGELMFRLKAVAEGRTPGPHFSAEGLAP